MYNGKRFLAVIPARGGSRGVPRKNIRELAGRPLLAYTADQVLAATLLDAAVVSSEDAEIRAVAESTGLRSIARPVELAADNAATEPALLHALDVLQEGGECFDYVVVLEPTSPFRTAATIDSGIRSIVDRGGDSLLAVRQIKENLGFVEDGLFRPLVPGAPRRRQDRKPVHAESSTIYICTVEWLRKTGTLVAPDWLAFEVADAEAVDINTTSDFAVADCLAQTKRSRA